jgi:hypothetical protein
MRGFQQIKNHLVKAGQISLLKLLSRMLIKDEHFKKASQNLPDLTKLNI